MAVVVESRPERASHDCLSFVNTNWNVEMTMDTLQAFISAPRGLHYALEQEIQDLGITETRAIPVGVEVVATLPDIYRILLWSRIANRVILELTRGKVSSVDEIYELCKTIDWPSHFEVDTTFAVDFHGTNAWLNNSTFGALRIKDAIVDQFRERAGQRPSVDRVAAAMRVAARLHKGYCVIGLDLSGESLHRRGYRQTAGKAPLKENLAAGLLRLAGWRESATQGECLVDPMCGSGTLLIEAAMIATQRPPNLDRDVWGFNAWLKHDAALWETHVQNAQDRHDEASRNCKVRIVGYDEHGPVIKKAWENIQRAGVEQWVHVESRPLREFTRTEKLERGLVITNPPYGERLGEKKELENLYRDLGRVFEGELAGWRAAVFTANAELSRHIGWRSHKQYKLFNGALESQLLLFQLQPEQRYKEAWMSQAERLADPQKWQITQEDRAAMLRNRLIKNNKTIGKWARQKGIDCYRLYDADMPEYAFALDVYGSEQGEVSLHVQEYLPPKSLPDKVAFERLSEALSVIRDAMEVPGERIYLKHRQRQKGLQQYEKQSRQNHRLIVREYDARIEVNLSDYLDTGLFLDHRAARRWINQHSTGKRVLNLFCYTAAVTVQAALGGASSSLSIDMSNTYLAWAKRNFVLNELDQTKHALLQADCIEWLRQPVAQKSSKFDVIFLDPPSFSNSKRMEGILDVQRDHAEMISLCMQRLAPGGVLFFSNNLQKFSLDAHLKARFDVQDWQKSSLDKDFERRPNIHHCWLLRHAKEG